MVAYRGCRCGEGIYGVKSGAEKYYKKLF